MRVVVLTESWPHANGTLMTAAATSDAVAREWAAQTPGADILPFSVGDGGARTADALAGPRARVGGVDVVTIGDTSVLAAPDGQRRWEPHALASALLGIAADHAHENGQHGRPRTVVVPVGDEPPAGDPTDVWLGGAESMRAGVAALDLVVAVSSQRTLLGFNGMSAALREGRENDPAMGRAAQAQEERWSDIARTGDSLASLRSLIGPTRLSDAPGSGAAGGLAYCLAVLGGRLQPAAPVFAALAGAETAVAHADLVAAVVPQLEPRTLDEGAIPAASELAARHGIPTIVIAPHARIGRRDLMNAGVTSAHAGEAGETGLADAVRRVASTWTRGA